MLLALLILISSYSLLLALFTGWDGMEDFLISDEKKWLRCMGSSSSSVVSIVPSDFEHADSSLPTEAISHFFCLHHSNRAYCSSSQTQHHCSYPPSPSTRVSARSRDFCATRYRNLIRNSDRSWQLGAHAISLSTQLAALRSNICAALERFPAARSRDLWW
ncbi:hypothetical protein B0H66DRAFT_191559 [Apodospora peruviana]|uniref:Uncharacterized protein n=1 Tax=Apodospora peruviana TaxID=516989 RepID=A0AAE0M870_9PEZI|nr:hypothetical protein B0H66DRAFT_191559 [Apodospora peruviana]